MSSQRLPVVSIDVESIIIQETDNNGSTVTTRHFPTCITIVDENYSKLYQKWIKINDNLRLYKNLSIHSLPIDFHQANSFDREIVEKEVLDILTGKIVTGYGVYYFLTLLQLRDLIPSENIRDLRKAGMFIIGQGPNFSTFTQISQEHLYRTFSRLKNSSFEYCVGFMEVYKIFEDFPLENWRGGEEEYFHMTV